MKSDKVILAIVISIALLGALGVLLATPYGLGVTPDSIMYLSAARSLRDGTGYVTMDWSGYVGFLGHFPPIFPSILSLIPEVIQQNSVWLQMLILAVSSYVTYLIACQAIKNRNLAIYSQILVTFSYCLYYIHTQVWTEPLALMLTLIIVYCAIRYFQPHAKTYYFWIVTILTMLFPLVRYAGLFLLPLAVLYFVARDVSIARITFSIKTIAKEFGELLKKRWWVWGAYSVVLLLPYVLWQLVVSDQGRSVRSLVWHPITMAKIVQGVNTVVSWIIGLEVSGMIDSVVIAALVGLVIVVIVKKWKELSAPLWIALTVAITYLVFLVISISLFDAATPLDQRILSLIYPLVVIVIVAFVDVLSKMVRIPWMTPIVLGIWGLITVYGGINYVVQGSQNGQQHANSWGESAKIVETAMQYHENNPGLIFLTNSIEYLYAYGETPSLRLPKKGGDIQSLFRQQRELYSRVCVAYVRGKSDVSGKLMSEAEVTETKNLKKEVETGDGAIYCFYK